MYDQYGHEAFEQARQGGGGPGAGGFGGGADFADIFGDVFGDIFGGGGRRQQARAQRGADLRYNLDMSLEEAVRGKTVELKIPTLVECEDCDGGGTERQQTSNLWSLSWCRSNSNAPGLCGSTNLSAMSAQVRLLVTHAVLVMDRVAKKKRRPVSENSSGVDTGDRIRLANEGEAGEHGAPAGDLYVQVHVREHPIFSRDGNNLYCEVPVSFTKAALGGEIEVPTLDGKVKLKVPKETQTGKHFRMRGKGVKSVRTGAVGDLICKVVIETPVNLSSKQREMLEELEESMGTGDEAAKFRPKEKGFFDGVKQFFDDLRG